MVADDIGSAYALCEQLHPRNSLVMNCPGCANEMTDMLLDSRMGPPVTLNLCLVCQMFWFDMYENLKLATGSTLRLMKFISEHPPKGPVLLAQDLRCPRCNSGLHLTHDFQRATRFSYWRCEQECGRFIGFVDFLREKDFIHPLTPQQIHELSQIVRIVKCSHCGAPVDLSSSTTCAHCGAPVSLLDMNLPQQMLNQLQQVTEPQAANPAPSSRQSQKEHDADASLALLKSQPEWASDVSSSGLVHAGLNAVARWLDKIPI